MGATRHHLFDRRRGDPQKKKHGIRISNGKEPNTLRAHAHETRLHLCGAPHNRVQRQWTSLSKVSGRGPTSTAMFGPCHLHAQLFFTRKSHVHFGCRTSNLTLCFKGQRTAQGVILHSLPINFESHLRCTVCCTVKQQKKIEHRSNV